MDIEKRPLPSKKQSFWSLACIQGAAIGLPGILISHQLAKVYGPGAALSAIVFGNLILWMISLGMVGMSIKSKTNAIQNASMYLGTWGGLCVAVIVLLTYTIWYSTQLLLTTNIITTLFHIPEQKLHIGLTLGLFTAFIAIKEIKIIRLISLITFPFIFFYFIYLAIHSLPSTPFSLTWSLSGSAILSIVSILLPGIINIPTFFRHSKSLSDSILGISLMIIFFITFQIFSVFISFSNWSDFFPSSHSISLIFNTAFLLLTLLTVNLVNIYFASAGWEMLLSKNSDQKKYFFIGILGTLIFVYFQNMQTILLIANLAGIFLAILGIVLLIDFLIKLIVQHRPRTLEKIISFICWFVGCIASSIQEMQHFNTASSMITGMLYTSFTFLFILFIEETLWSIRHLKKN